MPLHPSTLAAQYVNGDGNVRACHRRNTSWLALGNREHNGWARHTCSTWPGVDHQRHQQILHGNHHHTRLWELEHRDQHPAEYQRLDTSATRYISKNYAYTAGNARVLQGDLAGHKNSNGHQYQLHSGVMSGNQLGRGQDLDSDSIVWLQYEGQPDAPHIVKRARALLLSVVRGCGQPLDSCPRIYQKLFIGVEALVFADGIAYRVACLGTNFSRV